MKGRIFLLGSLVLVLSLAACYSTPAASPASSPTSTPSAGASSSLAPAKAATLKAGQNATLGQYLSDDQGRTLYLFITDTSTASTCYDACAQKWPPLLTQGAPTGTGITASLLGTSQRREGTAQVTYKGHPLYYYAPDQKPGDTTGQGVGSVWYVVSPAGDLIK
ncbi:MAG: hypothetical protein Q8R28_11655 [Dehalococcoidia bacterium]|nr:hypothetical protein [Dehalococcoidia bacterium]